jgi:hypothetical protein
MAVGRISGPLLKDNLLRNGVDLAFETNLLYLDVTDRRIGVNTSTPTNDLSVNGTTRSTNIQATNSATLASLTFSGSTISSTSNTISLLPSGSNAVVYQGTINVGNMTISGNTIAGSGTNTNLEITTTGTGSVEFNSNVTVFGNLHATGSITADGDITLGNATTDNVSFTGEVNSDIIPNATNTYNLGSLSLRWNNVYSNAVTVTSVNTTTISVPELKTANLDVIGNSITAYTANTDVNFVTSGTGGVVIGNLKFSNNSITNISANAVTTFNETGNGYLKVAGSYGFVIPVGNVANRPLTQYREAGMMRFNTELGLVEIFDGSAWGSVAGSSSGVTSATAQDIGVQTALALG